MFVFFSVSLPRVDLIGREDLHQEVAELRKRPNGLDIADKRVRELEAALERAQSERRTQEELNVEYQRRISTLSVCLSEMAELNAATLQPQLGPVKARALLERSDAVQVVGRQASIGLVHISEGRSLDHVLQQTGGVMPPSTPLSSDDNVTPMTPQILQDYQGEIERLKFRLRKRKAKMAQVREETAQARDREQAALLSVAKYEKHIKRLEREGDENVRKEAERRKQAELAAKNLKRRIAELEFLLEDEGEDEEAGAAAGSGSSGGGGGDGGAGANDDNGEEEDGNKNGDGGKEPKGKT